MSNAAEDIAPGLAGPVAQLARRSSAVIENLRDSARAARSGQRREPTFTISEAAALVGRTPAAIRDAEKDGRLPVIPRTETNRRVGYNLAQVNDMRGVFGTRPWRAKETDPCAVIAVQNFKGGVGKSTLSVHLAQYLAIQGYRVALIDCDSQASSTTLFGYVPDLDLTEDQTLYPFLREDDMRSLDYALLDTHFDGLKLIPANLRLFQSEYELAARMARGGSRLLDRLAQGIASISDQFDMIILDPPPALGAISLSVLRAANALVIPVPPTVMDFSSTAAFLAMLDETLTQLASRDLAPDLNFIRVVASKVDENKSMQKELIALMRQVFGLAMIRTPMKDSAEIDNVTARLMTVYEVDSPMTSKAVRDRCLTYLNGVNEEILLEVRKTWSSHVERLRKEGHA
jgi:chromosome partitioning protein